MASKTRKTKVAANVRAYYSRAEYVTPRVALDKPHAAALRRYMKREGFGVSDAIRAAILAAGGAGRPQPASKPRRVKSRSASRS